MGSGASLEHLWPENAFECKLDRKLYTKVVMLFHAMLKTPPTFMMEDLYGHMSYRFVNGAVYDGEWNKGKKHGKGVFSYPDGSKYDGIYSQNYMHFSLLLVYLCANFMYTYFTLCTNKPVNLACFLLV